MLTLQTAINPSDDPVDPMNASVPDPHPCSIDPCRILGNDIAMDLFILTRNENKK